jgi:hypothetical protein
LDAPITMMFDLTVAMNDKMLAVADFDGLHDARSGERACAGWTPARK